MSTPQTPSDQTPQQMIAALDSVLDEAYSLTQDVDRNSVSPEIGRALDLLAAAWSQMDEIMEAMNIPDPDPGESSDNDQNEQETAFRNLMGSSGR
jgi:hypothetical protein